MTAQGDPGAHDERAVRFRWIARAVVAAIGLWFLAHGLRGIWSDVGPLVQVLIGVGVVLGVGLAVLGLLRLGRRRPSREG